MRPCHRLEVRFRAVAERCPTAVCIEHGTARVTYGELEELSNRVAGLLLDDGLARGDRVGLCLPKSIATVATMLGVLKAGGVYVPIDPRSPARRLATIVRDCGMTSLVTDTLRADGALRELEAASPLRRAYVVGAGVDLHDARVRAWDDLGDYPPEAPRCDAGPEIAYILYTSGSTGRPKGVMLSHGNALAFVDWAREELRIGEHDRVAAHAPLAFDLSVLDVYGGLLSGAALVLVDESRAGDAEYLAGLLASERISILYAVPWTWILLMEHGDLAAKPLPDLRLVLFAGEEFPVKQLRRLVRMLPQALFYNLYGPTETNVCTYHRLLPEALSSERPLPIGRACSADEVTVRDAEGNVLGPGEQGEICVRGASVMLGYWPGDAHRTRDGEYATGDVGEWNERGELLFHGRRDFMVKVNGYRVEIREVEMALQAHPEVADLVVFAEEVPPGRRRLVAKIVAADPGLSVLAVKQFCAGRLPAYMVPEVVLLVAELPKTITGKTDRVRAAATMVECAVS